MEEAVGAPPSDPPDDPAIVSGHEGFGRLFGALQKSPYYRTFWFGNQASLLVLQMQTVAVGYLAFELTNSAMILGIVSFASGLPMLVFSPFAGVIADRYPKRLLLLLVQAVLCIDSVAIGVLVSVHWIQWWHLMVAAFIQGTCFSLNMPARQSWIPALVVPSELPNAIALNNAGMNAARIVGPALAGLLIAVPQVGVNGVFYFSVPAVAWVYFSLLQIPLLGLPEAGKRASFWTEFSIGMRYIWTHETLRPLFTLAVVTLLFGMSYQMLLPAYALGVFKVGSEGLGLMSAVVGVGALTGSLLMAYFSRSRRKGRIQAIAGTGLGIGLFLFGVASGFKLFGVALIVLLLVGLATDFYSTINNTLILVNTDRALFGRVMSIYMMTWSLAALAAAPFGTMVDKLGGPLTMMLIGGFLAIFVVSMTRLHPGFRKIE